MTMLGLLTSQFAESSTITQAFRLLYVEADRTAKRHVVVTVIIVIGAAAVSALVPLVFKTLIDTLGPNGDVIADLSPLSIVVIYVLFQWLARSLCELRGMYFGFADQRLQRQISFRLFQHVMSLPLCFHLDRETGALNQTLTNGLLGYRIVLHQLLLAVLPVTFELGAMCAVLIFLDQAVFLVAVCISVLLYIFIFWAGIRSITAPARAASKAHVDAYAVLTDSVLNYETVKYFRGETQVQERFVRAVVDSERQWARLFRRKMENGLAVAGLFALTLGVSVYLAAKAVQQGQMTIGEFVLVNAYILGITRPLEMLGFAIRDIAQGSAFIEGMIELVGQERETDVYGSRTSVPVRPPELAFERVSFSYNSSRCVLKDVSFVVPSGKSVAVVGPSGSGKSSLIRLLLRMTSPSAGRIRLNGIPLSEISLSALRNAIAVVPQDIVLFNDSIAYNIAFGNPSSTENDIIRAAKVAHIHDFIETLPEGYRTKVGERGLKLSGGEKQRVAIARAAIKKPKVFVFDEATSSLDSQTERAVLNDLFKEAGSTMLFIAHRLSTITNVDEIIVMDRGSVVERGNHEELLRRHQTYAGMWFAQNSNVDRYEDSASIV